MRRLFQVPESAKEVKGFPGNEEATSRANSSLVHLKSRRFRRNPISSRVDVRTRGEGALPRHTGSRFPDPCFVRQLLRQKHQVLLRDVSSPQVVQSSHLDVAQAVRCPRRNHRIKAEDPLFPTSSSVVSVSVSDEGAALRSPTPAVALKSEKMHRATFTEAEGHFSVPDVLKPAFGEVCMGRAVGWRGSGPV